MIIVLKYNRINNYFIDFINNKKSFYKPIYNILNKIKNYKKIY